MAGGCRAFASSRLTAICIALAARIQEAGVAVYGFGVKGAVQGFVRACDEFVFLDELVALQGA